MNIPAYLWHPIFVHFSVALLSVSTLFYLLSVVFPRASNRTRWIDFAQWNLWLGSGISVVTALLGWLAYNTVSHDDPSHEAMEVHATLALITLAAFGCIALWVALRKQATEGQLVFHYGLAVDSLPKSEGDAVEPPPPSSSPDSAIPKKEGAPTRTPHHHNHKHVVKHAE